MIAADALLKNADATHQGEKPTANATPVSGYHVTRREQEIQLLLAQRLTNQEISQMLGIGVRTVEHHVAQLLAKLGVANRRQVAPVTLRPSNNHGKGVS